VIDAHFAFAPDTKGDIAHYIIHDPSDRRLDLRKRCVGSDSQVSTGNVETNATERDLILVSHNAAYRLCISFMAIGAQHAVFTATRYTSFDLFDRCFIVLAKDFSFAGHNILEGQLIDRT
jgi:hypothetical protein